MSTQACSQWLLTTAVNSSVGYFFVGTRTHSKTASLLLPLCLRVRVPVCSYLLWIHGCLMEANNKNNRLIYCTAVVPRPGVQCFTLCFCLSHSKYFCIPFLPKYIRTHCANALFAFFYFQLLCLHAQNKVILILRLKNFPEGKENYK